MLFSIREDLWEYLLHAKKPIFLYGMGNGADKILSVLADRGIAVSGVFASDGFARGNLFHGMPVRTYGAIKEEVGADNMIVLLAFGTSREEVLENILRIDGETELYAPDVPAFGDTLFDRAFLEAHREDFMRARSLLCDEESVKIFDAVIWYKLTGRIEHLLEAESDMEGAWRELVPPETIHHALDLGAYNGDTVREWIARTGGSIERIDAFEPDARNFEKLRCYAEGEARCTVVPHHVAAWSERATLLFDKSGNRNASLTSNRSSVLEDRSIKMTEIQADTVDRVMSGRLVDLIKYDVEGSEREALMGSVETVRAHSPRLAVSLYHRSEDLFDLPLLLHELFPDFRGFYLRRARGIPAWDLSLFVTLDKGV